MVDVIPIPPLAVAEKALGEKASRWKARCYEIACAFVAKKLVPGVAVYGHWLGDVHPKSMFHVRHTAASFVQHGWVLLPNGYICDPTRWCFEAVKPYIFYGENDGEYDEGGNRMRLALRGRPPAYDPDEKHFTISKRIMDTETWNFVEKLLDIQYDAFGGQPVGELTNMQLSWLANTPPAELGKHVGAIYDALEKLGRTALIPIDNKRMVQRMRGDRS